MTRNHKDAARYFLKQDAEFALMAFAVIVAASACLLALEQILPTPTTKASTTCA